MTVVVLMLALLGLVVAALAIRELMGRRDLVGWPHKAFAVMAVVVGIASQSDLLPAGSVLQLIIVGGCSLAALFVLVGPAHWQTPLQPVRCGAAALVFLLWFDLFVTNAVQNSTSPLLALAERLAPGLFWLAVLLLWLGGGMRRDLLAVVLALAVALVAVVTPFLPEGVWSCSVFKCGVFGALLKGPFSSENHLAVLAALCLVLVLTCTVGALRWPTVALCVGLLLATGGRSSMIGAALGLAAWVVVRSAVRCRPHRSGPGAVVALGLPASFVAVGLSLVYLSSTDDLSRRGAIWIKARDTLSGHEIVGLGLSRWSGYGQHQPISYLFPHSQYLLVLFSGGLVATVLFTAVMVTSLLGAAADRRDFAATAAYVTTYLTIGLSEIVTNVMTVDGLTWAVLPLLAVGAQPAPRAGSVSAEPSRIPVCNRIRGDDR